ncbi:MAG: TetR/AcrR family transcriptional regulator [Rhizobiaceae bacterium]|nr:TetR/AcrR family transcriptional regulator [Rhizobiaceae bacterium]
MKHGSTLGRPAASSKLLTKETILNVALPIVQEGGVKALSFRLLAKQLGVTAMAVTYHCGNKKQLIGDLVEIAFAGIMDNLAKGEGAENIRAILVPYCERALQNANLLRAVLDDSSLMSSDLQAITTALTRDLRGLVDDEQTALNVLVDYTHGFVLSATVGDESSLTIKEYVKGLDWILKSHISN